MSYVAAWWRIESAIAKIAAYNVHETINRIAQPSSDGSGQPSIDDLNVGNPIRSKTIKILIVAV
jgi:hypothetical protein